MQWRHVTFTLVGVTTAVFLLQQVFTGFTSFLSLTADSFMATPWSIATSLFAHADYTHFFNNMFFLAVFGYMLEHYIGGKHFLTLYIGGGVLANISAFFFYPATPVLGASGAVSVVIAALAVLRPRNPGLFFGVPVPMWAAFLGWVLTNTLGAMGTGGNVAFEAHLAGLAVGALVGVYLRKHIHFHSRQDDGEEVDIPESVIRKWEEKHMK